MKATADAWAAVDPTLCDVCGRDGCEDHLATPDRLPAPPPRLSARRASEVIDAPSPREVVEGIAWAGCITTLVAESGAGKTFVALDLAAAVSDGVVWHGRDVSAGSVVYVPFEADDLGRRLRALRDVTGRRLEHLYVVPARDPLSPSSDRGHPETPSRGELDLRAAVADLRDRLAATGRPPVRLINVDTVRASLSGSEDASETVSAYLRAVRRVLADVPSAACLLTHHAGWQDGEARRRRERGSSAWRGNGEATLFLEADGEYDRNLGEQRLTLTSLKVRDGERPPPLHLVRRRVELTGGLPADVRRGPATSCVIEPDRRSGADREAEQARAADIERDAIDRRVLRAIATQATSSRDGVRLAVGLRRHVVIAAIDRVIGRGWVVPPARLRQPYEVTAAGRTAMAETTT